MFPLGTVLFPSVYLPLHVFEERYRAMVRFCLDHDRTFAVTLIERGSEVGGGDVRTTVGTSAQIIEATEMGDGRWALGAVGMQRIRIVRWLEDDPYPRAEIEPWPDEPTNSAPGDDPGDALTAVTGRLRRVLAIHAEMGDPVVAATVELSDDPMLASFQASAVAPFGPADHQALLVAESTSARLALLDQLLSDHEADLRHQLDLDP
jgi:uncharacterized protein